MALRIYRPARLVADGNGDQVALDTVTMKDFGDGTVMLRRATWDANLPDWLAVPWEKGGDRVCVCDEPIPDDWTYFEVLFSDVNFVAVSPVTGDREELKDQTPAGAPTGRGVRSRPNSAGGLVHQAKVTGEIKLFYSTTWRRGPGEIFISFPSRLRQIILIELHIRCITAV